MSITLEQAKNLRKGQILFRKFHKDSRGKPEKWRVNGVPKVWKRNPEKVKVPVKHGMYSFDYLTEWDLDIVSLETF